MKKRAFNLDAYPFVVRPMAQDEGDGGYVVEYPDVPHCMADGNTPEDAIRHGTMVLEGCLLAIAESGNAMLKPGTTTSSGQSRQRVPKGLHARLVRRA